MSKPPAAKTPHPEHPHPEPPHPEPPQTEPPQTPTRIAIVDDNPMLAEGIGALLDGCPDIYVVATLPDGRQMIDRLDSLVPDVILKGLNMPRPGGLPATGMILQQRPDTRILVLSMHDSPEYIATALNHGARGYVLRDVPTEEMKQAIDAVMADER